MRHGGLSLSGPRIIALAFAASSLTFFFCGDALRPVHFSGAGSSSVPSDGQNATTVTASHRKLLQHAMVEPNRRRGHKCRKTDIVVSQSPTSPLPSGIPTYTVEITNVCATGCDISHIHLSCGWFSSATLINPTIFKRLRYNDCLVNNAKPLKNGETLSFKYATTFSYPLAVSSAFCGGPKQ